MYNHYSLIISIIITVLDEGEIYKNNSMPINHRKCHKQGVSDDGTEGCMEEGEGEEREMCMNTGGCSVTLNQNHNYTQ